MSSSVASRKCKEANNESSSSRISPISFANSTLASLSRYQWSLSIFSRLHHSSSSLAVRNSHTASSSSSPPTASKSSTSKSCITTNTDSEPTLLRKGIERPVDLDYIWRLDPLPLEQQLEHAWSVKDKSNNIHISSNPMIFVRNPVAQSTDAIRGKQGYSKGLHVWRIGWDRSQRGTHAVIGVGTKSAPLEAHGYVTLVGGENEHSWGWNICNNVLYHNSISLGTYPSLKHQQELETLEQEELAHSEGGGLSLSALMNTNSNHSVGFRAPNDIYVVLDMNEGTLGFMVNGQFLGYAFRNLKGYTLYPMVSAVWGHCQVTLEYVNGLPPHPFSLMHSCRKCIYQYLEVNHLDTMVLSTLYLPQSIKNYLLYR